MTDKPQVQQDAETGMLPWEGGTVDFATTLEPLKALAVIDSSVPLADFLDQPFNLTDIVVHKATVIDPEGNPKDVARTILIDDKGRAFHAVSEGVLSSLKQITAVLDRRMPFDPPLKVKCVQKKTSAGRRIFKISVVG